MLSGEKMGKKKSRIKKAAVDQKGLFAGSSTFLKLGSCQKGNKASVKIWSYLPQDHMLGETYML